MKQSPITDIAVRTAQHPPAGHVMLWDTAMRGFGLRVGKQSKTFIVLIGGGRRQTIGRYPLVSLQQARGEAKRILAEKALGRVRPTFLAYEEAKKAYLEHCERENRTSTYKGYKSRLDRIDWGRSNLAEIGPRDVLQKLKQFDETPMEKRYAFVVLRSFFNWCVAEQHIDTSPMDKLEAPEKSKSRERVLSPGEIRAIWNACPDDAFGTSVKLLILTGQRRGEIATIALEGDLATIPSTSTKNHRTHTFPVGKVTQDLLAKDRVYGGWGKAKARLDRKVNEGRAKPIPEWTLHDIRRTFATIHAQLGTAPHLIEILLNHATGIISGVAATYNRYRYIDELKGPVHRYEAHIASLVN